jgi:hypothetical protein
MIFIINFFINDPKDLRVPVVVFLFLYPFFTFPLQHDDADRCAGHIPQNFRDTIDLTGSWIWEGRPMNDQDVVRNGRMEITLHQQGKNLSGTLIQINGPHGDVPKRGYVEGWNAHLSGTIVPAAPTQSSMIQLRRVNTDNDFEAIFTGNISDQGNRIDGFFVNNEGPGGGWFVMIKNESLHKESSGSDMKQHNLSASESARQVIQGMMEDFERGLSEKDRSLLLGLFDQPSTPVIGIEENEVRRQTAEQFIGYIVSSDQHIEEKLKNAVINVRSQLAVMTCDYEYIVDGEKLGGGIEIWTFIRTPEGWKIASFFWSVQS